MLWPLLADTNRFSEAMGLPAYVLEETPQPNGKVLRRHFQVSRVFSKGPFRRFGPVFDLSSDGKGSSVVCYALVWEPLTLMGRLFGRRLAEKAINLAPKAPMPIPA